MTGLHGDAWQDVQLLPVPGAALCVLSIWHWFVGACQLAGLAKTRGRVAAAAADMTLQAPASAVGWLTVADNQWEQYTARVNYQSHHTCTAHILTKHGLGSIQRPETHNMWVQTASTEGQLTQLLLPNDTRYTLPTAARAKPCRPPTTNLTTCQLTPPAAAGHEPTVLPVPPQSC